MMFRPQLPTIFSGSRIAFIAIPASCSRVKQVRLLHPGTVERTGIARGSNSVL